MKPKTSVLCSSLLKPRRIPLWLAITLALFILRHGFFNTTPHTKDNDENDTKPRFLYRSQFREDPDFEYEKRISDALQGIERDELAKKGPTLASETIWQIAKNEEQRGEDSKAFERQNRVWSYSVSYSQDHPQKGV